MESIFSPTYIVCDLETTGMSPYNNRITEIAMIRIQDGEITGEFKSLINPGQHIPYFITKLTGISNADVFGKPTFGMIAKDVMNFLKSEAGSGLNTDFRTDSNGEVYFVGHNAGFDYKFLFHSFEREGIKFEMKSLCTCKLANRLLKRLKSKSLGNVTAHLGIKIKKQHRAYDDALATAKVFRYFLGILSEKFEYEDVKDVIRFQNSKIYGSENLSPALKRIGLSLKELPRKPGVYFMKSRDGEILYIGKAKDIRERVSGYFRHNSEFPVKIRKLLSNIASLEYEVTNSELSALILESKMIKQHKPRFNSALKRYRYHPFLKIDVQNSYPRVEKVYEIENDGANYYGPFRSGMTVNRLLKDIDDEFKMRKCEKKILKASLDHSVCMYNEIGKCNAPCNFTQSKNEYDNEVLRVHEFITESEKNSVQRLYEMKMQEYSENMDYESAAFIRDRLKDIKKVMSYQKVITSAINGKKLIIKCVNDSAKEFFFIHNGKLAKTYSVSEEKEIDQNEIIRELTESADYLFFSLSKFVQHKFNPAELDEIKVISNWLALNKDRNSVFEIREDHSLNDVLKFITA
ncbi:MAG TPA: exonuclease domain-containing protein [Ignavibacteria bacterium]|nr:exonuclease domain-containing protein [Ignavibacteria bacterium]HRJ98650.1 exonuclease domain-containing protein [Ignavibacteria bacterium]